MTGNFRFRNTRAAALTPGQVKEIRERYGTGRWTQRTLADEYGLSVVQIGRIVRNESWKHLPPTPMGPQELQQSAQRLYEMQQKGLLGPVAKEEKRPPPMLLDGGDAADETDGSATERLNDALADRDADGLLNELKEKK